MESKERVVGPPDLPRLIQDVLAELGYDADAAAVAEQVRRLDVGLPAEDEFSVICAWLGKCQLLHKLDQHQLPIASKQLFQVPDLLAKFSTQTTKSPVLIEVKSKSKNEPLSFTPEYMTRLQNYADMVGMPLLVAWKFIGVWTLFEARHMKKAKKNFNIAISTAMQENILGKLAGDVAYQIGAGAGLHLRFRKDKLLGTERRDDGFTEHWETALDAVEFTNREGARCTGLDAEVQSLLMAWDLNETEENSDSHVHFHYVAGESGIQFAHTALVRLLNWESPQSARPHWRNLMRKEQVTASVANFSAALEAAYRQKVVSLILRTHPHTMPAFLEPATD